MDYPKPQQATPDTTLREQIMNSNFAKNEREHWAARRIEELEKALNFLLTARAVETLLVRTAAKHPDTVDDEDAELMNAASAARGLLNQK